MSNSLKRVEDFLNPGLPEGFEQLVIDNTAGGTKLTSAKYGTAKRAIITVEDAQIRYRVDGLAAPTLAIGHIAEAGDMIELESAEELAKFRAIRTGATSATIIVTYSNFK